jgi:exodeoxyribonuclease VII small subunit
MAKEKISYESSIKEIEEILEQIETGSLGVDELAGKVTRVSELLKACRQKLHQTEAQINKILDESPVDE